jgi:hypothetical protein
MVTDRQRPFPLLVLANLLSNPVRGKTDENPVLRLIISARFSLWAGHSALMCLDVATQMEESQ